MPAQDILRILLVISAGVLTLLAALYLRRRKLTWPEYLAWGLLALLPFLGPFLVIAMRPGRPRAARAVPSPAQPAAAPAVKKPA